MKSVMIALQRRGSMIYEDLRRLVRRMRGNIFDNQGPITDADFHAIKEGIEEVGPAVFLEIGTGTGVSTRRIYSYLSEMYPECEFYTIESFEPLYTRVQEEFAQDCGFHAVWGLSVRREETTSPAFEETANYKGPTNVLREVLSTLGEKRVGVAFIDSRKGSALPEFQVLADHMSEGGIVFCHDILNGGKGVEVRDYLDKHGDRYTYDILKTGRQGILEIRMSRDRPTAARRSRPT